MRCHLEKEQHMAHAKETSRCLC